jgi:hypothetical protein
LKIIAAIEVPPVDVKILSHLVLIDLFQTI